MNPEAHRHLARVDPVMRDLMRRAGPCTIRPVRGESPYRALVAAVAHQQLTAAAARTMLGRLRALYPHGDLPEPGELAATSLAALRGAGFSNAKSLALLDIATKTLAGVIPTRRSLARLDDEAIVERLVQVRGVGRWTVEMFLIFTLARPDVLPVDDYGVRNGFRIAYGLDAMPKPRELAEFGRRWAPCRTTAAWLLWRAVDLHRDAQRGPRGAAKKRKRPT
ncbi:MAG: DNA-3-methyladenine glycosylase 2 family protein [Steroidobacteraceae bacterium]